MEIFEHWNRTDGVLTETELFQLAGDFPAVLLYGEGDWLIAGWDPIATFMEPPFPIKFVRSGKIPPIQPDLMGFISYEFGYTLDAALPVLPPCPLPLFQFEIYRHIVLCHRPGKQTFRGVRNGESLALSVPLGSGPFRAQKVEDTDSPAVYMEKVAAIRDEIASGNVYQVDLTRQEKWTVSGDVREFALRLNRENPAPFSGFIQQRGFTIVSSSPERFLSLRDGIFLTSPIKGTAARGVSVEEDEVLARFLVNDEKNRAELAMIVDLLRNDLSTICKPGSVRVRSFPELESYTNVHHLVAHITGCSLEGISLADILKGTFPGGSITGCPKIAAMHLIRALEPEPRGIYTGSMGWISGDAAMMDLNIAIRTCTIQNGILTFGVGGGVVWDSNPADEYEETVKKGESIVKCLN
ncbi:MAG: anthranilate synthase component I family protein [Acidobacteria bacterium]|nr:anthranilate synthase component I family protein [Acidobacteriota bacterium]